MNTEFPDSPRNQAIACARHISLRVLQLSLLIPLISLGNSFAFGLAPNKATPLFWFGNFPISLESLPHLVISALLIVYFIHGHRVLHNTDPSLKVFVMVFPDTSKGFPRIPSSGILSLIAFAGVYCLADFLFTLAESFPFRRSIFFDFDFPFMLILILLLDYIQLQRVKPESTPQ
ncbi:hypothetical protein SAMN02745702_02223 [Desulfobaculum bizertense DSM 18034]|uniref:Uncharacterized protein n=1 Tax=Desulfobaculum bizertense DSM 18034 TaxID=1121442 RepID=A0A1T4WGB2_9BACT|nr:hypothetical protein SAMN02745702_02223 [Desulfobaculum bizertense DSM 18034]